MTRKVVANFIGWISVLCSVAFWVLLALLAVIGSPKADLAFGQWALVWGVALVLAIVAAAIGSRRWALAALLPVFNFLSLFVLVNLQEMRH
jgi:hypothetical protein